jgi:hypothetical protein
MSLRDLLQNLVRNCNGGIKLKGDELFIDQVLLKIRIWFKEKIVPKEEMFISTVIDAQKELVAFNKGRNSVITEILNKIGEEL